MTDILGDLLSFAEGGTKPILLKWFEDDKDTEPVYIPLHQVCGVFPQDVGTEDESLTVHLPNNTHVYTNHRDTIRRFWEYVEIV